MGIGTDQEQAPQAPSAPSHPHRLLIVDDEMGVDDEVNRIRHRTAALINEWILPNERVLTSRDPADAEVRHKLEATISGAVKEAGMWAPHLPAKYGGMGAGYFALAYMNELLGYSTCAGALFGFVAPNSGNQHLLITHGTEEQKRRWLDPLSAGEIQSGFSMTEPDSAGSDPRSVMTSAVKDGDEWCINGRKWFTSNGVDADFLVVMCKVVGPEETRMAQIIVPTDTPGVELVRQIPIWGQGPSDHCEFVYKDVRVPLENTIGGALSRDGEQHAQARLGAGRVFHCMYAVGQMNRAFDLMLERACTREARGELLRDKQLVQGFVADSYADIQGARLMTIHAAEAVDRNSPRSRIEISTIKVVVPQAWHRVVDRAIQVWGAAGITDDLPLAQMYLSARALRIADGPDEVHRIFVAKSVLREYAASRNWLFS